MFVAVIVISYLFKKIRSSEPNKIKYYSRFFIYYVYGSFLACILWPFFLLRPKSVDNAK